ncbi:Plant-specific TFIIB-related protein 1 [Porphyridium purpureum]|uniref:Plant-specific TFIIB-related protein 1 n=1 Tax=Porphyridium purpureum TaxID=35688 RepID=A0A5J4YVJ5_PORPP|nr:Plant-specific TFIIB-related protein 1 [Porphyridium purpureum]KAA8495519.1 Plant-specific TFIIB-related protein 1 [Porphyridium purpureum]|eukprot:POR9378..scf209_3
MVGSHDFCTDCRSSDVQLNVVARVVQCRACHFILEERLPLPCEVHALTHIEELHCAITPDFVAQHLVHAEIRDDPYFTRGFITAFRNLIPVREPLVCAAARSISGDLAEMERILGDAVYACYVGYNGRALRPMAPQQRSAKVGKSDGGNIGGPGASSSALASETRYRIVNYFLILEVCVLIGIPRRIVELANFIFRRVVARISLRNRSVETLAIASLVCAVERQRHRKDVLVSTVSEEHADVILPHYTDIARLSGEDPKAVLKYLRFVNDTLTVSKPRQVIASPVVVQTLCSQLELEDPVRDLCNEILIRVAQLEYGSRRNRTSLIAGALLMAISIESTTRKTQAEVARATKTSEVTLRKVVKELVERLREIIPPQQVAKAERKFRVRASPETGATNDEDGRAQASISTDTDSLVEHLRVFSSVAAASIFATGPDVRAARNANPGGRSPRQPKGLWSIPCAPRPPSLENKSYDSHQDLPWESWTN